MDQNPQVSGLTGQERKTFAGCPPPSQSDVQYLPSGLSLRVFKSLSDARRDMHTHTHTRGKWSDRCATQSLFARQTDGYIQLFGFHQKSAATNASSWSGIDRRVGLGKIVKKRVILFIHRAKDARGDTHRRRRGRKCWYLQYERRGGSLLIKNGVEMSHAAGA